MMQQTMLPQGMAIQQVRTLELSSFLSLKVQLAGTFLYQTSTLRPKPKLQSLEFFAKVPGQIQKLLADKCSRFRLL